MIEATAAGKILAQTQERQAMAGAGAIAAMARKGKGMSDAQMNAVAKDFEAMFISQMLGSMFGDSTLNLFGDQDAQEIYKEMMMDAYGKTMVNAGGIGIASYVKRELLALQEVKS